MKKIFIILILISSISFSKIFNFLQSDFKAEVIEKSNINNKNKKKEYELTYTKDKLDLKIVKPELNKGEIYTFTKNKKYLYSPKLKQKVEQSLSNHDESLYSILSDMAKLEKKETHKIKDKEYIFKNSILESIVAKDYQIFFKEYVDNKPKKILFVSNSVKIEYIINYR